MLEIRLKFKSKLCFLRGFLDLKRGFLNVLSCTVLTLKIKKEAFSIILIGLKAVPRL